MIRATQAGYASRVVLLFLLAIVCCFLELKVNGASWYVDNTATTSANTGTSWSNAWTSFAKVVWGVSGVKAGDTLYISGGSTSKVYTNSWTVGASGSLGNPIRIAIDSSNPSHSGIVVFDYNYLGDQATIAGITCNRNYITFDGNVGGECHFVIANLRNIMTRQAAVGIYADGSTGLVIDHIGSTNCNNAIRLASSANFKISNCKLLGVRGDAAIAASGSIGSWDANLIYSNVIEIVINSAVPPGKSTAYFGPDGIQCSSGVSIYANRFLVTRTSVYTSDQHPDTIQATGNYLKVYGNEFINVGDAAFDYDCYANSNPHDIQIYNNVFTVTSPMDNYPEFFRLYASFNSVSSIMNVKILNNTFVDNNFQFRVIRFDSFNANPTASGNEIKNNIFYNCGGGGSSTPVIYVQNSSGFNSNSFAFDANAYSRSTGFPYVSFRGSNYPASSWVDLYEPKGIVAPPVFVRYTAFSASNDFRLRSVDTVARDAGLSLNSYFLTDIDNVSRPQGGAWDIGAYEYGSGSASNNLPPAVSAVNHNAIDMDSSVPGLQIYAGTAVQYSGSASDPNGDALNWQWVYAVNGGSDVVFQSGTGTIGSISFNYGTGTAGNTYLWKLRVSDGQALMESQHTVSVIAPAGSATNLALEAESGSVASPFTVANGSIYQTIQTGVSNGGRAAYSFTITNAGDYIIEGIVNAPGDAENSFYVNIDAEPQDPSMVWQIPITSGFEKRIVNWQGDGTYDNPQFVPKIFNLGQGAHQLIIRGREANTRLDRISLIRNKNLPAPPTGLRIVVP